MGFLHQLHLLLWKNITLKRRSPWVLAFEIFIPLVLFFILLGLRQKKPTIPVKEVSFYTAAPLTSAGILPVMQSLCPEGQRDEFGFLQYSNSTVTQLLERINEVVEESNLFDPDRRGLEEELESLRRHLESMNNDPSSVENHFNSSKGFTLGSVVKDRDELQNFLTHNLTMSNETAGLLLGSNVNLKEVFRLCFGSYPSTVDSGLDSENWDAFNAGEKLLQIEEHLLGGWRKLEGGLIHKALSDPEKVAYRQTLVQLLAHALGLAGSSNSTDGYNPEALVREMENILFAPKVLEYLTCNDEQDDLQKILTIPASQKVRLSSYRAAVCNTTAKLQKEHFRELANKLQSQVDIQKIVEKLKLNEVNSTAVQHHLQALLEDLIEVEKILKDVDALSGLARLLPKGACAGKSPPTAANTTSWNNNFTTTNATSEEDEEPEKENPHTQFSAFVQLWAGLQPILCGNNRYNYKLSLMSTTAFGLGSKYFALYEVAGVGIQWHTLNQSPVEGDDFNLLLSMVMLIVDATVYGVLTWYIEAVHPGMYGLPRPWYFPFQKSYWLGNGRIETWEWSWPWSRSSRLSIMEDDQACAMESRRLEETRGIEEEPSHLPLVVCIDKLTKVYKTGKKLALNKLSLNLHENQVVSFLGHNGAGKTTTMSILTGLFPPTAGSATIYGHDIRTEMDEIRKNLGMCPQHNVLFDKLTVEEHLWFYSRLKGMAEDEIRKEMDKMIEDLELSNKRHSLVQTLSGGMKRKLSVAIAFVGGSKAVILDEPTAGVDPYARRAIWDLILKYKQGRTILLSTHYMDEADLLGDRIAIISHGKLKCCGSPLFLKSTYGDGYKLTVVKKQPDSQTSPDSGQDLSPSSGSPCLETKVSQFIKKYVVSTILVSDTNTEISYILPSEAVKKGCFERLFQALDLNLEDLNLTSFGLMDTTLEEVFLKVSEEDQSLENSDIDDKDSGKEALQTPHTENENGRQKDIRPQEGTNNLKVNMSNLVTCARLSQSQSSVHSSSSVGSVRGDEMGGYSEFYGDYTPLFDNLNDPDNLSLQAEPEPDLKSFVLEGQGSTKLEGSWLKLCQFYGLIVKRYHCAKRNTKSLFSQILLPAFFVCVAMTVALSVPEIGDLPPLILSPSQYHNYTQPRGNFIPYANEERNEYRIKLSPDASPQQLTNTFYLPSGIGATCVLKTPYNSTLDQLVQTLNLSTSETKMLASKYFDSMCLDSFTQGLPLSNFVPQPPSPAPSDFPDMGNDGGTYPWNLTTSPATMKETVTTSPSAPRPIHEPVRCSCSMQGTGFSCPNGVGGHPPQKKVVTGDILVDITGRNVSEYILHTSDRFRLHRYGGLTFGNVLKSIPASFSTKAAPMVRKIAVRRTAQAFYNNKGYHSMPTYLNTLNNAILRANLPKSKGNPAGYGITVTNHPMNKTSASLSLDYLLQGTDVVIAIFIIVAMSFVPASFVVFLVAEKSTKAKHLQFVSGCDPVIYWLANYVWDMLNYLVPATCCIIILFVFDLPAYTSPTNFPAVLSLFLLYGWSITPIMYPASFWFEVPSTAYVFLIVINLFIGITATVATFLLQLFEHDKDLKAVNSYLKSCFLIFPNYNLGHGLMEMAYNEYINEYYAKIGQFGKMKSPFEWDIVTRGLVAMTIEGFVGFFITIMCQYNFFRKPQRLPVSNKPIEDDDIDVGNERRRVLRGDADTDVLKIQNLTKVYKSRRMGRILAVDRLCTGVRPGECFGLLGVNGAGKTTTFKMLTGDESTTGGEAFVNGNSILKDLLKVQQSIGYCPQFDALFDELTAREHMELYTRLRGVPWKDEERVINWALDKLELTKYADKPAGTYSGGNKRKLSTAIALIGYPSLIFLDEPTTGMDPKARRFLWNLILDIIKTGRSVVLTSHSMEECEALCTRLAIMVNGRFKCLGSIQHLKNRFGDGYMITVRTKASLYVKEVVRFFNRNFPEAVLKERHHTKVQYQLKSENISLAQVFSKMEQVVDVLGIEDYSVSQTTLDNVFVNFAKKQSDNLEQQETVSTGSVQSPIKRILSLLRPRGATTELQALTVEEPEELESDDEGLISFEEERQSDVCHNHISHLSCPCSLLRDFVMTWELHNPILPPNYFHQRNKFKSKAMFEIH
ncbi:ATP-binding cassette sub-family A member 2 [Rhincodon typus]|uniref:ATP-binding cassette sub-family A member 2 n=1 Tax=Rhincodon typus TaxID=259920 RepID=UPI002030FD30|nr:ATP-binding cassette sub-family A member 2 [Rhincodon typus]